MGVVAPFWASQASRAQLQREPVSASIGHFANICRSAINQKAEKFLSEIRLAVAVGTIIADRPPHRSVRALLRIRLPPRMSSVKTLHRIRMENASDWNPSSDEPVKPVHGDIAALAATR